MAVKPSPFKKSSKKAPAKKSGGGMDYDAAMAKCMKSGKSMAACRKQCQGM
jgi:hypothetical protein